MSENITIRTEYIRLDQLLKFAGAAETGGAAKELIATGAVRVNGEVCLQRGRKLRGGDTVEVESENYTVVSDSESP